MFQLKAAPNGEKILVLSGPRTDSTQRGLWVSFGHENEKDIEKCVAINKKQGYLVERDLWGYYRAFVLFE